MAIGTPVSIGTVQNKNSESATVLTTTAAVPAGALIVVVFGRDFDGGDASGWSASDSASNTYTSSSNEFASASDGVGAGIGYAFNVAALPSGSSITITWSPGTQPAAKAVSAFYVEGIVTASARDALGKATGRSTTPSVSTSAGTTQADELTVGIVATEGPDEDTFTQDASPAYGNIPVRVGTSGQGPTSNITLAGGYFIESATGVKTYNPTLGSSRDWAAVIATFKGASDGNSYTGSGGAQSGGVAAPILSVAPKASGGALASGIAALALGAVFLASGGATSGGAATVSMDRAYTYAAQGGAQAGGVAPLQVGVVPQAAGGAQAGGVAALASGWVLQASGGAQSGGVAAVGSPTSYTYAAAGGAQSAGAAGLVAGRAVQASGGAQAGGVAPLQVGVVPQASGGAQAGGVAPPQVGAVWLASGGAQSGGVAEVVFPATYVYVGDGDGGAVSGGSALALSGFAAQLLTVRLRDAVGAPQVGAAVMARRVRVGGAKYTVIDPALSQAVTDGAGVAVLTLMPSLGDAYRVTATAGDGTPLLDVAVLVGPGDGELHSLPRVEGMQAWH